VFLRSDFWPGSGQPSVVWVWVWKISPKNPWFFNFCPSGQKSVVGSKSTRVRARLASYLLRVKSMFGSGQGPTLVRWKWLHLGHIGHQWGKFQFGPRMKVLWVLRVLFDAKVKFNNPIDCGLKKATTMFSALRLIRKKLKYDHLLKVMTSQYSGRCFYECIAWLNETNSFLDLRRINALPNRTL